MSRKFLKLKLEYLVADGNQLTSLEMVEEALKTMTPESCAKAVKFARWHMHQALGN